MHTIIAVVADDNPQRRLIAIDPGHSTGVAFFHGNVLAWTATTTPPHDELPAMIRQADEVVCEQGPVNRLQAATCSEVEEIVRREEQQTFWVKPSDWKGHPASRLTDNERAATRTRHERDAGSLGRWFLAHRERLVARAV